MSCSRLDDLIFQIRECSMEFVFHNVSKKRGNAFIMKLRPHNLAPTRHHTYPAVLVRCRFYDSVLPSKTYN